MREFLQNDLDYMDDNADRLGRQKMRSDAMKRQFAINGKPDSISISSLSVADVSSQTTNERRRLSLRAHSVMARMILYLRLPSSLLALERISRAQLKKSWYKVIASSSLSSII